MLRQVPAGRVVLAAAVTLYGLVGLVLLVACANVAGLMLVRAGEHRHEMGRRSALGATPRAIAALILRDGIRVIAGGCLVGAAVSWLLSCIVQRLIVGQAVVASAALIAVAGLMLIVGIVASLWPAQRAAAADPMKAFRHD